MKTRIPRAILAVVNRRSRAFSLLELLVAMSVLVMMMVATMSILNHTADLWLNNRARLASFQGARAGFEFLTQQIGQATLNTYWDYDDPANPTRYMRASDLHFVMGNGSEFLTDVDSPGQAIFFQALAGYTEARGQLQGAPDYTPLRSMLCATGFYLEYGPQRNLPTFLSAFSKQRSRLYRFLQAGEKLPIYDPDAKAGWISQSVLESSPIVDNVIGLILRARFSEGGQLRTSYLYDSKDASRAITLNQLPPIISVTMIVIDEESAVRLGSRYRETDPPEPFVDPERYEENLKRWKEHLDDMAPLVKYQIFTADIAIGNAKWSSE